MKRIVVLTIVLAMFVAACTQPAAPPAAEQTETEPTPAYRVKKVVAMAPSFAEIVIALGAGDRLAGRCSECEVPGLPPFAENIGGVMDPDMERLLALQPDAVIVQDTMGELKQKLETAGLLPIVVQSFTLKDIYQAITRIAELLEIPEEGLRLLGRMQQDLKEVASGKPAKPVRTLLVIGHDEGSLGELFLAGPGSYLDELLTLAGGENVIAEAKIPYPKMSKEQILKLNPEMILVLKPEKNVTPATQTKERELWKQMEYLQAVKTGNIFVLTQDLMLTPGPRVAVTAQILQAVLKQKKAAPAQ